MDAGKIEEFRALLLERRKQILAQIEHFEEALAYLEQSRPPEFSEEAQEEAARDRKEEVRQRKSQKALSPEVKDPEGLPPEPSPEFPGVREWWGKPEEARKSPFYYLTALRQSPPGTKSWG